MCLYIMNIEGILLRRERKQAVGGGGRRTIEVIIVHYDIQKQVRKPKQLNNEQCPK